jgi:hypothetical protein
MKPEISRAGAFADFAGAFADFKDSFIASTSMRSTDHSRPDPWDAVVKAARMGGAFRPLGPRQRRGDARPRFPNADRRRANPDPRRQHRFKPGGVDRRHESSTCPLYGRHSLAGQRDRRRA